MNADAREEIRRTGRVAFQHRDYTLYWLARVLGVLAIEMQITAVSWQVYQLTKEPLSLGLVGLAQFAPFALLFLVSGMAADRFPRIRILAACVMVQMMCAISFLAITLAGNANFGLIFTILIGLGIARTFQSPAQQAIVPLLVPKEHFANAVAWTSSGYQSARIVGPGAAGLLLILGTELVYTVVVGLFVASTVATLMIRVRTQIISKDPVTIANLLVGLRFIFPRQVILGVILLDLFAVLLGGARALLPIFAADILLVGAAGFGILRGADTMGSLACMFYLTQHPITRHAGVKMLVAAGVFGVAIMIFGLSTSFLLSVAALAIMGAGDAISIFIRNNVIQVITPDDIRGRVNAVNSVFIGASNELGEFESGVTAHWWGEVPAVVVGGAGTLFIAILFAKIFPQLRRIDSLDPDELIRRYRDLEPPPGTAVAE